ncbi:FMN-binding protein [Acholeplasma equifetale]|uniref:FMN-binding protein n=1 Tax=Acholeplasma equifetale TaxID=264634 RepID=UPI00047A79B7|nr:FMN-binding protein [Acholeplasma equifetale]
MKKYLQMMLFVIVLGLVASGILVGANEITKDYIAKNAEYAWKHSILEHHEIPHTQLDFSEVFDESFTVQTEFYEDGNTLTLYTNKVNNRISFRFFGNGLWDVIEGVITLEPDFNTVVAITVTKQAETPGLGGVVAEPEYLSNYVGKQFGDTGLKAVKNGATTNQEVDAITGATGTTNAFIGLLNTNFRKYYNTFSGEDILAPLKKAILSQHTIEYNDDNYNSVFYTHFEVVNKNNLTLYVNKTTNYKSYAFTTEGFRGPIEAVITLKEDFVTIHKITVLSQSEGQGAIIQNNPTFFDGYVGKKFKPVIIVTTDPNNENEVLDGFSTATQTKTKFINGMNDTYQIYYTTFQGGNQ